MGRGLSLYDVNGQVNITRCSFHENEVPKQEKTVLFGGGGLSVEFTRCSPGYPACNTDDVKQKTSSYYQINDCVFDSNRATDNSHPSSTVQIRTLVAGHQHSSGGGGIYIKIKGQSVNTSISIVNCIFYNNSAYHGGGVFFQLQNYAQNSIGPVHF